MEDLRPLSLGEIIDRSVSFWRRKWKALFGLYVGFSLAAYVAFKAGQVVMQHRFPALGGLHAFEAAQRGERLGSELLGGAAVMTASMLAYTFVSALGGVAVTRFALLAYLDQPSEPRAAMHDALARTGRTLGVFVLTVVWTLLAMALAMSPGAALIAIGLLTDGAATAILVVLGGLLASFGALVGFLWSILRFFLTSQLVAMEDLPLWRLFVRSGELTAGRVAPGLGGLVKVRLTVLLTVMGLVLFIVSLVGSLPQLALQVAYAPSLVQLDPALVPPWLLVPAELVDVIFTAVVAPLYVVFQSLVYLDMRVRREGFDLKLKLSGAAEALKAA